jgi:hypothetical protein
MIRLTQVFWTVASLDALMLVILLVMMITQKEGSHDGGREMAIFFFGIVPCAALVLAGLLFHFSSSVWARSIALFIVVVPGLLYLKSQVEDVLIDRRIDANHRGVGYFDGKAMRAMGAAVVKRDVETLKRLGSSVDVNAVGDGGMTLMRLAAESSGREKSDGTELPVVRELLALGAKGELAMEIAGNRSDSALLSVLLDGGANPNLKISEQQPLIFAVMSSITPANFRMLAQHGLDLNSKSYDDPLAVQLTIYRRWDLLAILIELGGDTSAKRKDGRNVADELASQIAEETKAGHVVPPELLHVQSMLQSAPRKP